MDRLGYAIYQLISALARMLPLTAGFRLGAMLGTLAWYVAAPYRALVLHNLRIAFPEKSDAERRELGREHFRTLGGNLLTSLKIPRLAWEEIEPLVTIEGLDAMNERVFGQRGFVVAISHFGNWEIFAQLAPVVFRAKAGTVFQRLGNPYLDAEVRRDRERRGLELFERKEGFTAAAKFLREKGGVGVLVDQHAGDAGLWCPFFGRLASTTIMPAMLALRADAFILSAAVYTTGVARWRVVFGEPQLPATRDVDALTAQINVTLEGQIRVQPQDWFWVHNRWKTPKPKFLLATYKRGVRTSGVGKRFRILIRGSNWLGDAIMSVPAVRAIKAGRPDAHVTLLTPAKLADVWKRVPEVDQVLTFAPEDNLLAVVRRLRGQEFDAAIVFPNSLRTALEVWLAGVPRRVGYPGHRRRWLLNQVLVDKKKKHTAPPPHQVHHYLALAKFVGAAEVSADLGGRKPSSTTVAGAPPVVGLVPGAEYGPAKRWLPERFAEVVKTVHAQTRCEWKVFGVAKDREVTDAIVAAAGVPVNDLVGKTTLAELMDQLATCDLLLTNDTGTMHLAAFLGVPVVALFGSTEPRLTGPLGAGHRVIRHQVVCSPCFLRECPLDFRCMQAITVEEVVAAVTGQLASRAGAIE